MASFSPSTTALVYRELNGTPKLETIKLKAPQEDEAVVEILATGICHTDLSMADGTIPANFPAVFGHEGAGKVISVGSKVKSVHPGDSVILSYAFCKTCEQCTDGHPAYCESFVPLNFGGARADGSKTLSLEDGSDCHGSCFGQSSFSKHAIVSECSLVKVPPGTDLALFSPLGCGIQTGAGCVLNTLNVPAGKSLAVFGVGGVGMAAVMAAKIRGANPIIAVDLHQGRLDLAKELGATHTILGSDSDVADQIRNICPPAGVKYAVDSSGVLKVIETMLDTLAVRGKAAGIGAPPAGARAGADVSTHVIMGREWVGCVEGDAIAKDFVPWMIEQQQKGNFPLEKLVTYYKVEDYDQAIKDSQSGKTIKAVLKWS